MHHLTWLGRALHLGRIPRQDQRLNPHPVLEAGQNPFCSTFPAKNRQRWRINGWKFITCQCRLSSLQKASFFFSSNYWCFRSCACGIIYCFNCLERVFCCDFLIVVVAALLIINNCYININVNINVNIDRRVCLLLFVARCCLFVNIYIYCCLNDINPCESHQQSPASIPDMAVSRNPTGCLHFKFKRALA